MSQCRGGVTSCRGGRTEKQRTLEYFNSMCAGRKGEVIVKRNGANVLKKRGLALKRRAKGFCKDGNSAIEEKDFPSNLEEGGKGGGGGKSHFLFDRGASQQQKRERDRFAGNCEGFRCQKFGINDRGVREWKVGEWRRNRGGNCPQLIRRTNIISFALRESMGVILEKASVRLPKRGGGGTPPFAGPFFRSGEDQRYPLHAVTKSRGVPWEEKGMERAKGRTRTGKSL